MLDNEQYTAFCEHCRGREGKPGVVIGTAYSRLGMKARIPIWLGHANQRHHQVTISIGGKQVLRLPQDIPPGGVLNIRNLIINRHMITGGRIL